LRKVTFECNGDVIDFFIGFNGIGFGDLPFDAFDDLIFCYGKWTIYR
jgi:hypothetical protein